MNIITTTGGGSIAVRSQDIYDKLLAYAAAADTAYSKNTSEARLNDLKVYAEFCAESGAVAFPATGEHIAQFVKWMADVKGWKVATIRRRISTISTYHRAVDEADPCTQGYHVKLALKAVENATAEPQKQAAPMRREDLKRVLKRLEKEEECQALILRDKAILLMAYDTMLRRSELARVTMADFAPMKDESGALVAYSLRVVNGKGKKAADPKNKDFRFVSRETYAAVLDWMEYSGPSRSGEIFRQVINGEVIPAAMDGQGIYYVINKRSNGEFSAHSLRVGAAVDQRAAGLSAMEIAQSGGWKSLTMPMRYSAAVETNESGMFKLAQKQKRV